MPPEDKSSPLAKYFSELWNVVSPAEMLKGLAALNAQPDAAALVKSILQGSGQLGTQAGENISQGNYGTAVRKAIEALVPMIGPAASQYGDLVQKGEIARGAGGYSGLLLQLLGPKLLSEIPGGAIWDKIAGKGKSPVAAAGRHPDLALTQAGGTFGPGANVELGSPTAPRPNFIRDSWQQDTIDPKPTGFDPDWGRRFQEFYNERWPEHKLKSSSTSSEQATAGVRAYDLLTEAQKANLNDIASTIPEGNYESLTGMSKKSQSDPGRFLFDAFERMVKIDPEVAHADFAGTGIPEIWHTRGTTDFGIAKWEQAQKQINFHKDSLEAQQYAELMDAIEQQVTKNRAARKDPGDVQYTREELNETAAQLWRNAGLKPPLTIGAALEGSTAGPGKVLPFKPKPGSPTEIPITKGERPEGPGSFFEKIYRGETEGGPPATPAQYGHFSPEGKWIEGNRHREYYTDEEWADWQEWLKQNARKHPTPPPVTRFEVKTAIDRVGMEAGKDQIAEIFGEDAAKYRKAWYDMVTGKRGSDAGKAASDLVRLLEDKLPSGPLKYRAAQIRWTMDELRGEANTRGIE